MLGLVGAILAVVISLCWYLPGIRAQGKNRVLTKKDYWKTAGVFGFCYTSILIIVTEILWDGIASRAGLSGFKRELLSDFLRAALLEEFFKFTGFLLAKRALKLWRKIDYIMIAGLIGLEYEQAKARNDRPNMRREMLTATALPFVFHGCWDSGLDLISWLMEKESVIAQVISVVLTLAMLIFGVLYTVRTIKKVCAIARASSEARP